MAVMRLFVGEFVLIKACLFTKYLAHVHKNGINATAMNAKLDEQRTTIVLFHYTVGNVFPAWYSLDLTVKRCASKVRILNNCGKVGDSRTSRGAFLTSKEIIE